MIAAGHAHRDHFREGPDNLQLSSIGLGTYLGGHDPATDALYCAAIKQAVAAGCNVLDSAINYRCQRSERVVGRALADLMQEQIVSREEIVLATKGGFIPSDGKPPRDMAAYVKKTFVMPGIIKPSEIVAECHCMAPSYLRHQLDASLANLGVSCIDVYYLHNPETQLDEIPEAEFMKRMRAAFEVLERAVAEGKIRVYGTATWDGYRSRPNSRGHLSLEVLVGLAREVGGAGHHFRVIQVPYNLGMPEALASQTQHIGGALVSLLEAAKVLGLYVMSSAAMLQGELSRGLPATLRAALGEPTDARGAIQFVRSTPGVGTALVGMKQADHVRDNMGVAQRPPLDPSQFAAIFA
jgi:aryl-alcohol dehydrogenase-like predicted oxidoreductase